MTGAGDDVPVTCSRGRSGRAGGCASSSNTFGGVYKLIVGGFTLYLWETRDAYEGGEVSEIRTLVVKADKKTMLLIEPTN